MRRGGEPPELLTFDTVRSLEGARAIGAEWQERRRTDRAAFDVLLPAVRTVMDAAEAARLHGRVRLRAAVGGS